MNPLADIVRRLGGHVYDNGRRALVPGPAHSRRDQSLSLWVNDEGRVIFFSHASDTVDEIRAYLGIGASSEAELSPRLRAKARAERQRALAQDRARKMAFCRRVWEEARIQPTKPIAIYLRDGRSIPIRTIPTVLRFHPAAPRSYAADRTSPAMVALIQDQEGQACGLHVTYLSKSFMDHEGRIIFGNAHGGSVRLHPASDELAVCEGIETSLSYAFIHARPTWALLSTAQFTSFQPPLSVDRLHVGPDMDDKLGTSLKLALDMQKRITTADVTLDKPPPGHDWNSHLQAKTPK